MACAVVGDVVRMAGREPRRCRACGKVLLQRPGEQAHKFRRRAVCNRACARQHLRAVASGLALCQQCGWVLEGEGPTCGPEDNPCCARRTTARAEG